MSNGRSAVYMGTPDFAAAPLQGMIDAGYDIKAVFTQPDRPKGRKGELAAPPVKELALKASLDVFQCERIRDPENVRILKELDADVYVVAAFGQILPAQILELPRLGCINIHASLLPAYRGAAPIQWAVMRGEKETGITTMLMNEGLDTGDIIMQSRVQIAPDETGGSLFEKLKEPAVSTLLKTLDALWDGSASFTPQPDESTTPYASMLSRKSGLIDWNRSADEIERMVRALDPWPGCYTTLGRKQLKLWKTRVSEEDGWPAQSVPGSVVRVQDGTIGVKTGKGVLLISELQLEGKKRMDSASFLRGNPVEEGLLLGGAL